MYISVLKRGLSICHKYYYERYHSLIRGDYENYEEPIFIKKNTDFREIVDNTINTGKSYFYVQDLEKYNDFLLKNCNRKYENTNPNYLKSYKGTVVVPIRIETAKLYDVSKKDSYTFTSVFPNKTIENRILKTKQFIFRLVGQSELLNFFTLFLLLISLCHILGLFVVVLIEKQIQIICFDNFSLFSKKRKNEKIRYIVFVLDLSICANIKTKDNFTIKYNFKGVIMKIIFYDVEHGSCCHIITPNNKHILVDIGSKTNSSIVSHINKKYFNGSGGNIDELIITHPHEDHIYDLPNLNEYLPPKVLCRPKDAFDIEPTQNTFFHQKLAECANRINRDYSTPVVENESPTNSEVNGGVSFNIISPKSDWTSKEDINTFSSVIVVKAFGFKFVLTGDNPADILYKMVNENHCDIKKHIANATVLLAPHHGRTGEFCKEFFDCVNPYLTVVSDQMIEYGTQEDTAKLYKGRGVELNGEVRYVLTTRNDGTISFDISNEICTVSFNEEGYQ